MILHISYRCCEIRSDMALPGKEVKNIYIQMEIIYLR